MYYLKIKNTQNQEIEFVFSELNDALDLINTLNAKGEILLYQIISDEFSAATKKEN